MDFANAIFARACVECPEDPPQCKECPSGQMCTLTVQTCQRCPEAKCVSNGQQTSNHAGAIAGGVVGGLVGLGFLIGGFLWYKYRHRRRRHLQRLQQQALELTPPNSPTYSEEYPELKAPSITTTHGDSQMLPIEIHFNQSPFGNPYIGDGHPVIRESIRESEYSFGSGDANSENNGGLRHYDVAVQGRANLVNLDRARKQRPQPPLNRMAQGQLYDIVEHNESAFLAGPRPASPHASTTRAASTRTQPARPASARPGNGDRRESQRYINISDREQTPGSNRYSRASSREYVADLPDEARLYESHGYFET